MKLIPNTNKAAAWQLFAQILQKYVDAESTRI